MLQTGQNHRSAAICLAVVAGLILAWGAEAVWGQVRANSGRGLDASRQLGSGGRNSSFRVFRGGFNPSYGNQLISGNVAGGRSFRGLGGTQDTRQFQASLGSSTLSAFARDSYGLGSNPGTQGAAQPFYLPSSTVLGVRGVTGGLARPGSNIPRTADLIPPPPSGPAQGQRTTGVPSRFAGPAPVDLRVNLGPNRRELAPLTAQPVVETASNLFGIRRMTPGLGSVQTPFVAPGEILPERTIEPLPGQAGAKPSFQALPEWAKPTAPGSTELERETVPGVLPQPLPLTPEQESLNQNLQKAGELIEQSSGRLGLPTIVDVYKQMLAESAAERQLPPGTGQDGTEAISPLVPSPEEDQEEAARRLGAKLRSYNTFVGSQRSSFNGYMTLGESLLKQANYYQAASAYRRAIELRPENPLAYLGRAYSLTGAGDLISAADSLGKALAIFPEQAQSRIDLPEFFHSQIELDRITGKLVNLIEAKTENVRVRLLLGYIYHYSGQDNLASAVLTEAADLAKTDPKVPAGLAQAIAKFAQAVSTQAQKIPG